jgi:drug/metabolite transporter, DME family
LFPIGIEAEEGMFFMYSQKRSTRDFLCIVCASIAWSTVGIANQAIYAHSAANALSLAFFRLAIGAPLFILAGLRLLGPRLFHIKWRALRLMLLMGGLQALYQVSYSAAIAYAGVTVSTLIAICAAPVIVALFSTFIARERLTLATLIALVGALAGTILLVVARAHPSSGNVSLFGVALAFLSACGYAGFILCGRRLSSDYHALQVNAVAFGTGALLLLFVATFTQLVVVYPLWGWFLLLYLGCVPTGLAFALFQIGMRSLSATVVSIITMLEPLMAAVLAWIFFQEQLTSLGLLGAALLLGSMVMILLAPKKLMTQSL